MSYQLSSIDFLDEKVIPYKVKEFSPDAEKGAVNVAKEFDQSPHHFLKTLIFEGKGGKLYMCLVGGDQSVELKALAAATGEEMEMADPEKIKAELGFVIGSIPPFGLKKEISIFIEESLQTEKEFGVGSGQWGVEIFINPEDLVTATKAKYTNLVLKYEKVDWANLRIDDKYSPRIDSAKELKKYVYLSDITEHVDKEVTYTGWMYNKRSSGKIQFLQFRDGTGDIQAIVEKSAVNEEIWNDAEELTLESSLQLTGKVKADDRSPFGYEMSVTDIKIIQISPEFPISKKEHGPDFLLDNRHLWLRSQSQRAILRVRDEIFFSLISFLRDEKFVRIDTPIFQPVSCEDTSELFEVDYFGDKTYLTQSGQLYCEAAEMALGRTYDFGPVFRAEKSKTRKHLIEFWMMDAELPFTDLEGLINFEEKLVKRLVSDVLKNCAKELKVLGRDTAILQKYVDKDFIRMTHKEAIELLNEKYDMELGYLDDIGSPEEAKLAELFDMPIFISEWPAEIKAFYMPKFNQKNSPTDKNLDDVERVKAVDLVASEGFGEIIGGSERIFDYNKLLEILEEKGYPYQDYEWYMDLRKYGTIPHSGFGIGLERFVRWMTGIHHIRETIPFPRMLNRLYP